MFYGEQTGYIPILSPPVAANPICAAPSLVPTRAVNEPSRTLVPTLFKCLFGIVSYY